MGNLVHQLLNLAHLDNASPEMSIQNMSRIVTGAILPFESLAFDKGKKIDFSID